MVIKRLVVCVLLFLILVVGVSALPFTWQIEELLEKPAPCLRHCFDTYEEHDLGGVFAVHEVTKLAGHITGRSCSKADWHFFDGGIALYLGGSNIDSWKVASACKKCWTNYNHDFRGQFASSLRVCGGADDCHQVNLPFTARYNRQNEIGSVGLSDTDPTYLGSADEFFDEISAQEGQSGWSISVSSNNPEVMIWFDDNPANTKTTDKNSIITACADTNQNNQCDFDESSFSNCETNGGDWYRGTCCGVDTQACEFVDSVNALCGKNSAGQFEWAPIDEPGEIHELFDCPGGSVVSDGTRLNQCGGSIPSDLANRVAQIQQKGFKTASVNGFVHDYFCIGKSLYECGGSGTPFSSINSKFTGDIAPGSATTCPAGMIGYWPMDGNTQDFVFGNHGSNNGALFGVGQVGQAAIFTGDGRIEVANTAVLNPNLLTVEAWIKIPADQTSGTNTIVHKDDAYQLIVKDGVLQGAVQTDNGQTWALHGTGIVPTGVWAHVAMIYDGSDLSLYINGNEMDSVTISGNIQSSGSLLFIGEASDAVNIPSQFAFYGSIDEVAIYDGIVLPADLASHYNTPENYCPTTTFDVPETYYCASDGDWTKDLDIKDKESCDLSGFEGTGTYCCSEDDDDNEYYNDPLGTAKSIDDIIVDEGGNVERTGENITLDESGAWAEFRGPAQLHVYEWSERERTAGEFETCKFLGKDFVDIPTGEAKFVYVIEPAPSDPPNTNCTLRRKEVVVESAPGHGGCWNKNIVDSGNYAPQTSQKVLNYRGQFYGCNVTDQALLALTDYHVPAPTDADDLTDQLINNSVQRCGYVFYDSSGDAAEPHMVCSPSGDWETTDKLIGEFEKAVKWTLPINITGIKNTGCCADNQCWNGTECQTLHSYYRVLDQGYVCEFAEDVDEGVILGPPPSPCTDSDDGRDYSVKGTVQSTEQGWEKGRTDFCRTVVNKDKTKVTECTQGGVLAAAGGQCELTEHYCDSDNQPDLQILPCGNCKDGACLD